MTTHSVSTPGALLEEARNLLLKHREDYDQARATFAWPRFDTFNFALDWFDRIGNDPERGARRALHLCLPNGDDCVRTYRELTEASNRAANWMREQGMRRGDRVLLMLDNRIELWETQLGAMKLGAPLIPTAVMMPPADIADRMQRGRATFAITDAENAEKFAGIEGEYTLIVCGADDQRLAELSTLLPDSVTLTSFAHHVHAEATFTPTEATDARDPLLCYFTSGTTSKAKLVSHSHYSYSCGHLSTLYWMGLQPGDRHLNVASPGWGKHAWSNFFVPFIAEATAVVVIQDRFDASDLMQRMNEVGVTSFCAPPTVWRMLIQADLANVKVPPTSAISAGEPLNAHVINAVQQAWGVTIRDGYGQTETTAQIANTPGQPVNPGVMGKALPGFEIALLDSDGLHTTEGEICIRLDGAPAGVMEGYVDEPERTAEVVKDGWYHTRDVAVLDEHGTFTFVGRTDDVFKASDYRISPFELESVLIEHPAVAEAAVVPAADPVRTAVPKAYIVLASDYEPSMEVARSILAYARQSLAPYKRVRKVEFTELPKTISGKIRRVVLREREQAREAFGAPETTSEQKRAGGYEVEYSETDFPELRKQER